MEEKLFRSHLQSIDFLLGLKKGAWGYTSDEVDWPEWPVFFFWIAAAPRENSPSKYVMRFELSGYNPSAPLGIFWDQEGKKILPISKWPKVTGVHEQAFRRDINHGTALYAPWDRCGLNHHPEWREKHRGFSWEHGDEISKYLRIMHSILNSESYHGSFS